MSKLNAEQEAALEKVRQADERYRSTKKALREKYRRRAEWEASTEKSQRDYLAWKALQFGVPKSQIARIGLGTSHADAATEAVENGRALVEWLGKEEMENTTA